MQFLTPSEAKKRLPPRKKDPRKKGHSFPIPSDAGARVKLVADIMARLRGGKIYLVYSEWGVWPSGQRMHLFDRLRASYGETRPLAEAPVQIFKADEFEDAVSFVTLGVLFLWDVDVFGKEAVYFSHDEIGVATFNVARRQGN